MKDCVLLGQVTALRSCEYIPFVRLNETRPELSRNVHGMSLCLSSRALTVTDVLQSSHGRMYLTIESKKSFETE